MADEKKGLLAVERLLYGSLLFRLKRKYKNKYSLQGLVKKFGKDLKFSSRSTGFGPMGVANYYTKAKVTVSPCPSSFSALVDNTASKYSSCILHTSCVICGGHGELHYYTAAGYRCSTNNIRVGRILKSNCSLILCHEHRIAALNNKLSKRDYLALQVWVGKAFGMNVTRMKHGYFKKK